MIPAPALILVHDSKVLSWKDSSLPNDPTKDTTGIFLLVATKKGTIVNF